MESLFLYLRCHLHFQWRICRYAFCVSQLCIGFYSGNITAAIEDYVQRFPWRRIPDWCVLVMFTNICEKVAHFQVSLTAECLAQQSAWWGKHLLKWQSAVHVSVPGNFSPTSIFHIWVWETLHSEGLLLYHIQWIQHLELADMGMRFIGLMHTPFCITTFCSMMRHTLLMGESIILETLNYELMIIHMEQ
jgi:hypothetical protein